MANFSILLALVFFSFTTFALALSPPSPTLAPYQPPLQSPTSSPSPTSPTPSLVTILQKFGYFTALIRLLKATSMDAQVDSLIKAANGVTFFAPTDAAFSKLKSGTLNSFSTQQQVELLQFHVISSFLSTSQFQTVSNPIFTLADGSNDGKFPLNITINGGEIDLSTGVNNGTITNTLYSKNQLAVYQVDRVLLPRKLFLPSLTAKAPTPTADVETSPAVATPKTVKQQPVTAVSVESSAAEGFAATMSVVAIAVATAITMSFQ